MGRFYLEKIYNETKRWVQKVFLLKGIILKACMSNIRIRPLNLKSEDGADELRGSQKTTFDWHRHPRFSSSHFTEPSLPEVLLLPSNQLLLLLFFFFLSELAMGIIDTINSPSKMAWWRSMRLGPSVKQTCKWSAWDVDDEDRGQAGIWSLRVGEWGPFFKHGRLASWF